MKTATLSLQPSALALIGLDEWGWYLAEQQELYGRQSFIWLWDETPARRRTAVARGWCEVTTPEEIPPATSDQHWLIVNVPPLQRPKWITIGLQRGWSILTWPPIAMSAQIAEELCQLAQSRQRKLITIPKLSLTPSWRLAHQVLGAHSLGELKWIQCTSILGMSAHHDRPEASSPMSSASQYAMPQALAPDRLAPSVVFEQGPLEIIADWLDQVRRWSDLDWHQGWMLRPTEHSVRCGLILTSDIVLECDIRPQGIDCAGLGWTITGSHATWQIDTLSYQQVDGEIVTQKIHLGESLPDNTINQLFSMNHTVDCCDSCQIIRVADLCALFRSTWERLSRIPHPQLLMLSPQASCSSETLG